MMRRTAQIALASVLGTTCSAGAATIVIDEIGGPGVLRSYRSEGVFSTASPTFSDEDMIELHGAIQKSGIDTDERVTFILIETDSDGLAFVGLVDEQMGMSRGMGTHLGGAADMASLDVATNANTMRPEFINDQGLDITEDAVIGGRHIIGGRFNWDATMNGDAVAWSNLMGGDVLQFAFEAVLPETFNGLTMTNPFQFLSWNGDEFELIAEAGFTVPSPGNDMQFGFTGRVVVIPLPLSTALAGAGLFGVLSVRRRTLA